MAQTTLASRLALVRRRLLIVGGSAAVVWGLFCALLALAACVWFDLVWELSPQWRVGLLAGTLLAALAVIAKWFVSVLADASGVSVAGRIDRAGGTGGVVLSGWQLSCRKKAPNQRALTSGLIEIAVERAAAAATDVPVEEAAPNRPLIRPAVAAAAALVSIGLILLCFPTLARTEWRRFASPWSDVPAYSRNTFEVEPGAAEVLYGSDLTVTATVHGPPVERVELVLETAGREEAVPMFADSEGRWQTSLTRIIEPADYHVRAHRARSERYQIRVVTIPRIEQVRVRIVPPAYTGLAPYDGPVPKDGIAGLPGTEVILRARSNRPLSGGTVTLRGESETTEVSMTTSDEDECEAVGRFAIKSDAKLVLAVIDTAEQASRDTYEASVTMLPDESPFLRILQPRAQSLATETANLPVVLSAEDDYGLSSVKLYRSLNDSRALPVEIPLPKQISRRVYEQLYLPLGDYGVRAGDQIKLFARAEDNDPAGPKGSESHVVVITVISQEEFDRMTVMRKGLETLTSKYQEARRRLEALAAELEAARDELAKAAPDSPASEAARKRLEELQKRFEKEAEAISKLSTNSLPFDLDKQLNPELEKAAKLSKEIAEALKKLAEEEAARNSELTGQLSALMKRLGAGRQDFDAAAMVPLEWLEDIYPLMADQSRFITLVLQQMDLAERLTSLKGQETVDASTKSRMRDLEEEQRRIRNDLSTLLDDIVNHAESLPDDERLDVLHDTAMQFAKDVRESGVFDAMTGAETALAEFAGTRAHEKAQEAADILQQFLNRCENGQGPGCEGEKCLAFQPTLAQGLGNTISQLLSQMGLPGGKGFGAGSGSGTGTGNGYSATRSGNVGLYGGPTGMADSGQGPAGEGMSTGNALSGGGVGGTYGSANPDRDSLTNLPGVDEAVGRGNENIPARYRRKVGRYFQRLTEEIDGP